jgi:signal transduction histidine kinase
MLSSECNGGDNQPAGAKDSEGRIWFPTARGVVAVDPRAVHQNDAAPPVVIEQVVADGEIIYGDGLDRNAPRPVLGSRPMALAAGHARLLEIRYAANSFVAPEKVRFRYRMEGHDREWRDGGGSRVAYYNSLRPGDYRFQVKACNNHSYWNETGATFAFSLAPHFWQTWPFAAACAAAAVALAAGIQRHRLGVQRRILRLEQAAALQAERARIAKDLHDDLGATLTGVALQADVARRHARQPAALDAQLDAISRGARSLVEQMRETVWAMNPACDTIESAVSFLCQFAETFLAAASIRCRLDVPREIPPVELSADARHHLFLALKEALNNVVKHASAAEVWLRFQFDDEALTLTVQDDGRGFDSTLLNGAGQGLKNLRNRLETLAGSFELNTTPDHGARIRLRIPLANSAVKTRQAL